MWISRPAFLCSCQYCLVRYTSAYLLTVPVWLYYITQKTRDLNPIPDSNVMEGHQWPTTERHRLPVVAHQTDVQLIASGLLATLFSGGGSLVVNQWQIPPSDCRLYATGGPPVAYLPLIATGGPLE